jgi:hypothetical protein
MTAMFPTRTSSFLEVKRNIRPRALKGITGMLDLSADSHISASLGTP